MRGPAHRQSENLRMGVGLLLLLAGFGSAPSAFSQARSFVGSGPRQLVVEMVAHELGSNDHSLWRYRQREDTDDSVRLSEIVETSQGELHRLLAVNGKPLSADEDRKEQARIDRLVSSPEAWRRRRDEENKDAAYERALLQMLPDAFRYEYLGTQNGLVELAFTPNPEFHSASREGQVFHNMAGRIWIDSSQKRLAHIQGRLINKVKFGGGLLGHLDAGGTFLVEQQQVGPHSWEVKRLHIEMLGKALFFKLIQLRQDDRNFDFEPVPNNLTLRGAAQLLRDSTTRVAEAARNLE